MIPRVNHLVHTLPPSQIADAMAWFDAKVIETARTLLDLPEPLSCLSSLLLNMPIREAGFGLRSMVEVSPAAYFGSLALAAPLVVNMLSTSERAVGETAEALESCFVALQHVPFDRLEIPTTPARFWVEYGRDPGRKLQNIMRVAGSLRFDHVLEGASSHEKALLRSMRSKGASAWLIAVPSSKALTLSRTQLSRAAQLRLLVPMCGERVDGGEFLCVDCGASLRVDPQHGHACPSTRRQAVTGRHDNCTGWLAGAMRRAGGHVRIERTLGGDRLDIDAMFDRQELMDISYVSPGCPTYCRAAAVASLEAARLRERAKIARYSERADAEGAFLGPFVVEITGAIGPMASRYLTLLARRIGDQVGETRSVSQIRRELVEQLSICTQRGNARIAACWRQRQGLARWG